MQNVLDFETFLNPYRKLEPRGTTVERIYSDFLIDGRSLLLDLLQADGKTEEDRESFTSCFVRGFDELNQIELDGLLGHGQPDTTEGHYELYFCPVCQLLVCGAYVVKIHFDSSSVRWYDFASIDHIGNPQPLILGPFVFDGLQYRDALIRGSAA